MSIKKVSCSNFFYFGLTIDSSSLYSVYLAYRKLWLRFEEKKTATTHTHKEERDYKISRLEKDETK